MTGHREKPYDIVVFGATGYTGKYVAEEIAKITSIHNIKWAVAGRHKEKLMECLQEVQELLQLDKNFIRSGAGILIADTQDPGSLSLMCSKARLVLNCVGPYIHHGEAVVRACIENGTHLVDLSGEFKYLEETQAKYFEAARHEGVYVVQSCGFDSIPADLGTSLIKKKFNEEIGEMNSVKIYVKFVDGPEGTVINIGTWLSAVHSIKYMFQAAKVRYNLKQQVFKNQMPDYNVGLSLRSFLSYHGYVGKWCVPLPAPDVPVIQRSEMFKCQFNNEPPVRDIEVFLTVSSFFRAVGLIFLATIFGVLSFFSFGRYLLGKYPKFFSFGYFSKDGPTRSQVLGNSVVVSLRGSGYRYVASETDIGIHERHDNIEPRRKELSNEVQDINLKITGPDPAYILTSICMVHAGLVILEEEEKLPLEGGVLTPGIAFLNTSLQERLESRGIKFELIK